MFTKYSRILTRRSLEAHLRKPYQYQLPQTMAQNQRSLSTSVESIFTDKCHKRMDASQFSSFELTFKAFAHYSQAIRAGSHVWLSGQIPADVNGKLIQGSTSDKTKAIIQNAKAILEEAGSSLEHVVKVVVYVRDAKIMPEFNEVYNPAFPQRPARSMVEVSNLPAGVDIQVDFSAVVKGLEKL